MHVNLSHIIGDDLLHSNNRICCLIIYRSTLVICIMEFKLELHWIKKKKIIIRSIH